MASTITHRQIYRILSCVLTVADVVVDAAEQIDQQCRCADVDQLPLRALALPAPCLSDELDLLGPCSIRPVLSVRY